MALDYLPQSLSEMLKGRRDVTLELLRKGVEKFYMNPVYLLTGKGNFFSDDHDNVPSNEVTKPVEAAHPIYFIPHILGKKYIAERRNQAFLSKLEKIHLPGVNTPGLKLRAFEMHTEDWFPFFSIGDILISEKIDPSSGFSTISDEKIYVIVTKNSIVVNKIDLSAISKGILLRYVENKKDKKMNLKLSDMLELWEVKLKVSRHIESENGILSSLLSEIQDIRELFYNASNAIV
jgi:hypothetical protein